MTSRVSAPTTAELFAKYRPVFARIAEGSLQRELNRILPTEQVQWLKEAGFTAVRVPLEFGGDGATVRQLFELLVELAAADPHIPQSFRGHIAFVEDQVYSPPSKDRAEWLARFVAGEMVGNAVTEIGTVAVGDVRTKLTPVNGGGASGFTITGSKYYTTGSIFAEWIDTSAMLPDGREVAALVSTATPLVSVTDDWAGFGQKLTGSGTAVFSQAPVEAGHVYLFTDRFPYQTALYQLILVAVAAGIARSAANDATLQVANRSRTFSHGNSDETRHDPQILEIVGRIAASATAALAITLFAAEGLQRASESRELGITAVAEAKREAEILSAEAQIVATRLSLECSTALFDGLGASAVSTSIALDRHWRNVRTVTSHNPVAFKARIVGDWLVNQAEPPYEWAIGVGRPASTK